MTEEIVASHMKAQVGYGDTSDPYNSSSLLPGRTIKRSPAAQALMKGMECVVPAKDRSDSTDFGDLNKQTRTISAAPIKPAHSMGQAPTHVMPTSANAMTPRRPSSVAAKPGVFER